MLDAFDSIGFGKAAEGFGVLEKGQALHLSFGFLVSPWETVIEAGLGKARSLN